MFRTARDKFRTWVTAGIGTAAALFVATLLGAFGALPKPPVPDLPANEAIEAGQWRVRPLSAYISLKNVYGMPIEPGKKALVFEVGMTNRTAESTKDYFQVFRPEGDVVEGEKMPFVAMIRDSILSPELHPAMEERMAYIWPLPMNQPVPERLSLAVTAKTYKPRDNLYGVPGWYNPRVLGTVTLVVGKARATEAGSL